MEDKERIIKVDIEQEMRKSYIDYSMSVIVARALPDVRDGFKPVHRRILFGMKELGNVHSKPYKKSARIVGEVLGKYHPHGDSSVYGALVRMAQEWAMRYTLVDGQGNFGSIDGDSPAAMRYTEARLSMMGEAMMDDLDKETVDMTMNFDDTLPEPTVMPTKIPNLLVNGATGIAVGMATNIPTHNLSEVIDACVAYIDNEDMDVEALMQYVKGPDFPTGAYIMGLQGIKDAYETGRGRVIMRAKADIESGDLHDKIIVTEIPYGVNKQQLIEYIAQLVSDKKLEGISNVNDESDREGMRIVVDVKRDANTRVVLNKLFKMTPLQTSFPVNSIALVKGRPQLLTLKDFISNFVKHRHEVTIRRTKYDLRKAEERAHILKGLIIASDNIDEVVQIIKKSKTPVDAQRALEERFNLDELQSKAIVDMRLAQLTGLNQEKLHAEFDELMEKIKYYNQILTDDNLCRKVMKDELTEIKDQFGDERRTEILPSAEEFNAEDFYADDEVVVTISHLGYVKRIPLAEFKAQNRGGIGVKATATRDNDFVEKIYPATMHNTMMFFTERGRCYWLKVYDIPEGSKNNKGRAIQNMLNIDAGDSVTNCLCIRKLNDPDFCKSHYVMFATKQGIIKKTCLTEYSRVRTNGVNAINIREDDSVVAVELTNGKNEIIVANAGGRAVRFNESEVRPMGRVSTGVQSIILDKDPRDGVIGMCVINDVENESIMVLSENGFGKRTDVEEYRKTSRHCKGVKTIAITEKTGYLVAILVVKDEDDLMIINKSGVTIRLHADDIKTTKSRVTQGVKVIELKKRNDVISHLSVVPRSDEEEETAETTEASEETATENESNE
ncbi:MAG: DNA gyrase subunit A [Bacteroidaceae bacterium]|nr:DNA gyrase subunit A [Bacteroidaceae bacterium]MBR1903093.1 DNA gyrase subunit A [Bacteroidaceae bacterium]